MPSAQRSATMLTCLKPGPMPPPVVGFAKPAASPNSMARSRTGRRTMPPGMGPQYRATIWQFANRSACRDVCMRPCNSASGDACSRRSGDDQSPIRCVPKPVGMAHAKNPGAMDSPVNISSHRLSVWNPVTSTWFPIMISFGLPLRSQWRTRLWAPSAPITRRQVVVPEVDSRWW